MTDPENIEEQTDRLCKEAYDRMKQRQDAQPAAFNKQLHESQLQISRDDLKAKSGVSARHWATQPNREGPWGDVCKFAISRLGTGFMLALIGGRGPGKTQLGTEVMRDQMCVRYQTAYYLSATSFFLRIKDTYKSDSKKTEQDVLHDLRKFNLLVIDELSKRSESEWENRLFHELIDQRYQDKTDTLLLANTDPKGFGECVGDSLSSRINQLGGVIECNWPSFRTAK